MVYYRETRETCVITDGSGRSIAMPDIVLAVLYVLAGSVGLFLLYLLLRFVLTLVDGVIIWWLGSLISVGLGLLIGISLILAGILFVKSLMIPFIILGIAAIFVSIIAYTACHK